MSLALNLNSQIEHIHTDRLLTGGSSWGRGFAIGLLVALAILLPLFFLYALTNPHNGSQGLGLSGMTLKQYALSPIPTSAVKDYLGS
jgi:hypothetical protein